MRLMYLLLLIGLWLWTSTPQLAQAAYSSSRDSRLDNLSAALIPPDEPVIILSASEWSSFAPYYSFSSVPVSPRCAMGRPPLQSHSLHWKRQHSKEAHWRLQPSGLSHSPALGESGAQRRLSQR
jgi:hypothetical protein